MDNSGGSSKGQMTEIWTVLMRFQIEMRIPLGIGHLYCVLTKNLSIFYPVSWDFEEC
jgi:hypothetical protein